MERLLASILVYLGAGALLATLINSFIYFPKLSYYKRELQKCKEAHQATLSNYSQLQEEHLELQKACTISKQQMAVKIERLIQEAQRRPRQIPPVVNIPQNESEECRLIKEMIDKAVEGEQ